MSFFKKSSILKASIIGLIIFVCFNSLFVSKNKVFILSGRLGSPTPVEMTVHVESSSKERGYTALFYQKLEKDGFFQIVLQANKLFGIRLTLKTGQEYLSLSDLQVEGEKSLDLSFEDAKFSGVLEKQIIDNGKGVILSVNPKHSTIVFDNFSLPRARRVYDVSPLLVICFVPLLWVLWRFPYQREIARFFLFFLPLVLLCCIKYFSFEHPYDLYYQSLSVKNIFLLEKYDFSIFALIYGLLSLMLCCSRRWTRLVIAVFMVILFVILMIDGIVLHNLNSRFIFSEATNYKSEYSTAFYMLLTYLGTIQGRLMLLCCAVLWYLFRHYSKFTSKKYKITGVIVVVTLCLTTYFWQTDFLFDYQFYNVFKVNQNQNQRKAYSQQFIDDMLDKFSLSQNCVRGLNKRKNVIVIITESLSSFASQKISGLNDYMPKLDKLMEENAVYTSYYSNSYDTIGSIFSLLSGVPLLHGYSGLGRSDKVDFFKQSLPHKLKSAGYTSYYWTAVEPNKTVRKIIRLSGFDFVSDYEDPFYDDKPRIVFNGAADEYLFENVMHHLSQKQDKTPYLMVLLTVSGHGPYVHPETKERSFEKVTEYVDREIDYFVHQLKQSGFFENGMVVITGDHRAMLPVSAEENTSQAPLAEARVPLIIIDKDIKGQKTGIYSHNDLAPSLQYYLAKEGCFNDFQNNLFDDKNQETCILYQHLSPADKVDVLCSNHRASICLNGDATSFCLGKDSQKYLDYVNWLRIKQETE